MSRRFCTAIAVAAAALAAGAASAEVTVGVTLGATGPGASWVSGAAQQFVQQLPPVRPHPQSRTGVDVPRLRHGHKAAAPGPCEELSAAKLHIGVVGACHHDAGKWESQKMNGAEAPGFGRSVGRRIHVWGGNQ